MGLRTGTEAALRGGGPGTGRARRMTQRPVGLRITRGATRLALFRPLTLSRVIVTLR